MNNFVKEGIVNSEKEYESAVVMAMSFIIIIGIFLMALLSQNKSSDYIKAIIGEAEGESYKGKLAVACAIRNRGTLNGVYGIKSNRVKNKLYSRNVLIDATLAWEESSKKENCEFINGADSWDNVPQRAKTLQIGNQFFYKAGVIW